MIRDSLLLLLLVAALCSLAGCQKAIVSQDLTASGVRAENMPSDNASMIHQDVGTDENGDVVYGPPQFNASYVTGQPAPVNLDGESAQFVGANPASALVLQDLRIFGWISQDAHIGTLERPLMDPDGAPYRNPDGSAVIVKMTDFSITSSDVIAAHDKQVQFALDATKALAPEQRLLEIGKMAEMGKITQNAADAAINITKAIYGLP